MRSFFRFAMLSLVLIAVALVSALTAMRFAIHGQEVQIPAIVGMTPAEAERAVSALGLMLEVERQYYSPQIAEGRIMSQLPLPGTKVRRGWQVRVAQSMGPQRVAIPDVIKESERAAEWNIRRRGLDLATVAELPLPGVPPDQVVAQSPPANASQVAAPRISLLLAVAADDPTYVMPSFAGQPLGSVSRTLQEAGFKLGSVTIAAAEVAAGNAPASFSAPPQPSPASIVMVQSPSAGQKVSAGATINFAVR
jgi:eukaryotic-like serine/threonine-protein kinase